MVEEELYLYAGRKDLGLPWWLRGKESACSAGDAGDPGSIPGSGRSHGGGCGNPLQRSCRENPMGRGAQQATVHGVPKSHTQPKQLSTHTCTAVCHLLKAINLAQRVKHLPAMWETWV